MVDEDIVVLVVLESVVDVPFPSLEDSVVAIGQDFALFVQVPHQTTGLPANWESRRVGPEPHSEHE